MQDNANFFYDATNHYLGIGLTNPTNQLTIYTNTNNSGTAINANTTGLMITNASNADGSYSSLRFNHPNSGDQTYIKSVYHLNNINELVFGGAGGTEDMIKLYMNGGNYNLNTFTIFPNTAGRVGIGTTTPTQALDVNGSIAIPATTSSSTGVIYKGTDRFIHNFAGPAAAGGNTFLGINAGNFTMAGSSENEGSYNTGIGYQTLTSNTTGGENTATGGFALTANTTGSANTANGYYALYSNTTGSYNTANGDYALSENTTGSGNTANGDLALQSNATGSYNTANGTFALNTNTTGANNTATGYYALSVSTGDNNTATGANALHNNNGGSGNVALGSYAGYYEAGSDTFYVNNVLETNQANDRAYSLLYGTFSGSAGSVTNQQLTINAPSIYMPYLTAGSGGTVYADANGKLWASLSSLRYKHDIQPLTENWDAILQVQPKSFEYKGSNQSDIGYIAEDIDALGLKDLVLYDNEGRPNSIKYDRIALYNTELIKQQQIAINEIKQRLGIAIEDLEINPAGTSGSGEVSGVAISGFDQSVQSSLSKLGATLSGGIFTLKQIIADSLTVKTARIEKMEMVDSATGSIYCTWVENGEWKKAQGDCASITTASAVETTAPADATGSLEETTTPSTTPGTSSTTNDQVSQQINNLSQQVNQQQQATQQAQDTAQQAQDTANQAQEIAQQVQEQVQQVQEQPQPLNIILVDNIPDINVSYGTQLSSLNLPTTVTATLSDISTQSVNIVWDNGIPSYDPNTSGTYVFSGTLTFSGNITNTNNLEINVNVTVAQQPSPAESPVSMTGDLIKSTVSALVDGVLKFIGWLMDYGSKAVSSLQIAQKAGTSLIQASLLLQSLSSSLEVKSLTTGLAEFFGPIMKWLSK